MSENRRRPQEGERVRILPTATPEKYTLRTGPGWNSKMDDMVGREHTLQRYSSSGWALVGGWSWMPEDVVPADDPSLPPLSLRDGDGVHASGCSPAGLEFVRLRAGELGIPLARGWDDTGPAGVSFSGGSIVRVPVGHKHVSNPIAFLEFVSRMEATASEPPRVVDARTGEVHLARVSYSPSEEDTTLHVGCYDVPAKVARRIRDRVLEARALSVKGRPVLFDDTAQQVHFGMHRVGYDDVAAAVAYLERQLAAHKNDNGER